MANRHFFPGLFERLFLAFPRLIGRQLSTNPNSNVKNRDELNGYSQNLPLRETFFASPSALLLFLSYLPVLSRRGASRGR